VLKKKRFEYLGSELTDAILIRACESLVEQGHTPRAVVPNGTAKGRKKVTIVTPYTFLGIKTPVNRTIVVIIRIEPENRNYGVFNIEYMPKPTKEVSRVEH
jgi:hypothetical protein